jgi:acetylornithine deacetylase/succinyl-diaminopimelate desuccinylase-like protein
MLSIRLPPTLDSVYAEKVIKDSLEADPPHGAHVSFKPEHSVSGWAAPKMDPWLLQAVQDASWSFFNKPCGFTGCGGSIPFMAMLGYMFPSAQFVITGVLGPRSNAHGPNEFMHIEFTKRITCCVAGILSAHHKHVSSSISK